MHKIAKLIVLLFVAVAALSGRVVSAETHHQPNETTNAPTAPACGNKGNENMPFSYTSLHYYIEYDNLVNANITDFVLPLETAWLKLFDEYGWPEPPLHNIPGVGERYHVIIASGDFTAFVDTIGIYVDAVGDNPNTTAVETNAHESCMALPTVWDTTTYPLDQLIEGTVSHELMHSFQAGIGGLTGANRPHRIFTEGMANWVVDEVFDDVDYTYYSGYPDIASCMGQHSPLNDPYHYWPVWRGMTEPYGSNAAGPSEDIMATFWQNIGTGSGQLAALDSALADHGNSLDQAFHDYAINGRIRRACSPTLDQPYCFDEAANLGSAPAPIHATMSNINQVIFGSVQDHYAARYIDVPEINDYTLEIENIGASGTMRASLVCDRGISVDVIPFPDVAEAGETVGINMCLDLQSCIGPNGASIVVTNEEVVSQNPNSCQADSFKISATSCSPQTFVVTTADDFAARGNDLTLRQAIEDANANISPDTIIFDLSGDEIIDLANVLGTLDITDDLTIRGYDTRKPTVDGGDAMQIFTIADGVDVSFENITIEDANTNSLGGAIRNGTGDLTLTNVALLSNNALAGGGLYNGGGSVSIMNSEINNNTANTGAGIFNSSGAAPGSGQLTIQQSTLAFNAARFGGGGLSTNGEATVSVLGGTEIRNNFALDGDGGGIVQNGGELNVSAGLIHLNRANQNGGGIANLNGTVNLNATLGTLAITNNQAQNGNGGGIFDESGNVLELSGTTQLIRVADNSSQADGGGIYLNEGSSLIVNNMVEISGNSAANDGGGIFQTFGGVDLHAVSQRPLIFNNEATNGNGGGVYLYRVDSTSQNLGVAQLSAVDVRGNSAPNGFGGGILAWVSDVELYSLQVEDNVALKGGGVYASYLSDVLISGQLAGSTRGGGAFCNPATLPTNSYCSTFINNRAEGDGTNRGGGLFAVGADVIVERMVFHGNSAEYGAAIGTEFNTDLDISNSLFYDNDATINYAIEANNIDPFLSNSLEITSTTIADNALTGVGFTSSIGVFNLSNSIVWGNGDGVTSQQTVGGDCSISQNGVGGTNSDPQFMTTGRGDYRLAVNSPAVDQCLTGPQRDLDNTQRPQGSRYDMGAFEYTSSPTAVHLVYLPLVQSNVASATVIIAASGLSLTTLSVLLLGLPYKRQTADD